MGILITLLGAECTGKSTLARGLLAHLRSQAADAVLVNEYLREWCDAHQRTPLPHEQQHIADTQQARIAAAAAQHAMVVADTTALVTAVYSETLFADSALLASALTQQRAASLNLLMGLDLAWQADGLQRDGAHTRAPLDQRLRSALTGAGIVYQVVYGQGPMRLQNAIDSIATCAAFPWARSMKPVKKWAWLCDKCSDPDCEHQLFTQHVRQQPGQQAGPTEPIQS